MKLLRYKIRDEILFFPANWSKESIVKWMNQSMRICSICEKIDVHYDHFEHCDPVGERYNRANQELLYR